MSEQELQQWELRQRDAREKALKTIASAFEDLTMLENWSRRTPAYEVECSCGRRLSVRTKADTAHEALTNELADVRAQLEAAAQPPAPIENHRERADYNAVMNGVAAALNRDGLTWEQIDEVTDACLTFVENHHSVRCPDEMCPCSFVGDNAERDLVKHYLPVHAPITAEDVRAAERAWADCPRGWTEDRQTRKAAFVADYLNRRGER